MPTRRRWRPTSFWSTSLLEPAMILVMGAVVGFIVVSVLLPIFEMNQLVR